jgi:cell division protein FtsW (lipid II flippase)
MRELTNAFKDFGERLKASERLGPAIGVAIGVPAFLMLLQASLPDHGNLYLLSAILLGVIAAGFWCMGRHDEDVRAVLLLFAALVRALSRIVNWAFNWIELVTRPKP